MTAAPDASADEEAEVLTLAVVLKEQAQAAREAQAHDRARKQATEETAACLGADAFIDEARGRVAQRRRDDAVFANKMAESLRKRRSILITFGGLSVLFVILGCILWKGGSGDEGPQRLNHTPALGAASSSTPYRSLGSRSTERARAMDIAEEKAAWRDELEEVEQHIDAEAPDGCRAKWAQEEQCYAEGRLLSAATWEEEQSQLQLRASQLRRNLETAEGR
jgi:hypothetical protein